MLDLPVLCQELSLQQADIVREFNDATAQPPWDPLSADERINFLRPLIRPLLRLALVIPDSDRDCLCHRTLAVAGCHGQHRYAQGFSEEILVRDFHHLGKTIVLHLAVADPEAVESEAFCRIEGLLSLACLASFHGYHRGEYEIRGEWPDALERLGRELPLYCH